MAKKYRIHLSPEEREHLQNIVKAGKAAASKRQREQILLATDARKVGGELRDEDIAKVLDVSIATVERTRRALCEHGLEVAVQGWPPHRKVPRTKLGGWAEAHLVAATCSPPPEGASRWTLKLLGDHLVGGARRGQRVAARERRARFHRRSGGECEGGKCSSRTSRTAAFTGSGAMAR